MPFDGSNPNTKQDVSAKLLLQDAARLLESQKRWTKNLSEATGMFGAKRFCAIGAVAYARHQHVYGMPTLVIAVRVLDGLAEQRGFRNAAALNDAYATTHADIKQLFADAIASL